MLASNILTYKDFLKDSAEPLELRKVIIFMANNHIISPFLL